MRRINIPENIQPIDPLTKQPAPFIMWKQWFLVCVVNDSRMGTTPVELARVVKLVDRVAEATPGRYVDMDEEDWSRAKPIVENPNPQLALGGPLLMMQLAKFPEVFLKAQFIDETKPARKTKEANGSTASEANGKQ